MEWMLGKDVKASTRVPSIAPTMQSITARNANARRGQQRMLITEMSYSDSDEEADITHHVTKSNMRRVPFKVTALYDYTAKSAGELSFREGDIISVTECSDDPWWYGSVAGRGSGSFPSNYVNA